MTVLQIIQIIVIIFLIGVYVWNLVELQKYKKQTTDTIEGKILELRVKLEDVKNLAVIARELAQNDEQELDQLREYILWRQYLIDTNFCGKLKNKKLLQEFVNCFPTNGFSGDTHTKSFQRFKEATLKCENIHRATVKNWDKIFFDILKELSDLEKKQEILDKYKTETIKNTKKETKQK